METRCRLSRGQELNRARRIITAVALIQAAAAPTKRHLPSGVRSDDECDPLVRKLKNHLREQSAYLDLDNRAHELISSAHIAKSVS